MTFCLPYETFKTAFHLVIAVAISQRNSSIYLFSPERLESNLGSLSLLEKGSATLKSCASCQAAKHSFYVHYEQGGNAFQHSVSWSWVNYCSSSIYPWQADTVRVHSHSVCINCIPV